MAPSTLDAYRSALLQLEEWAAEEGRDALESLTEEDLLAFASHRRRDAPGTWQRRNAAIRWYFGYLVETGQRKDNPSGVLPKPPTTRRGLGGPVQLSAALSKLTQRDRLVARFFEEMKGELKNEEAFSIREQVPVPRRIRVRNVSGRTREIDLPEPARRALNRLGGGLGWSERTVLAKFQAAGLKIGDVSGPARTAVTVRFHPRLEALVHGHVDDGEYEGAARQAYIDVEIRLREVTESTAHGKELVALAFQETGALGKHLGADRTALEKLFGGAMAYFRNELSHEHVEYEDPMEAREVLLLADLLLRLIDGVVGEAPRVSTSD